MMTGEGEQPTIRISTTEKKEDLRLSLPTNCAVSWNMWKSTATCSRRDNSRLLLPLSFDGFPNMYLSYVDTAGKNAKKIEEYIKHQLDEDQAGEQLTMGNY